MRSIPCAPRKSRSTWSDSSAVTATGPTRASEGVRTPPVSTTRCPLRRLVEQLGHRHRVRHDGEVGDVAHRAGQLVGRRARPRCRWWSRDRPAARRQPAMARFSAVISDDFAEKPGSSAARGTTAIAPPCTRSSEPSRARSSMSRRTVMSETPSSRRGRRPGRRPSRPTSRGSGSAVGWRARRSPFPDHGDLAREPAAGPGRRRGVGHQVVSGDGDSQLVVGVVERGRASWGPRSAGGRPRRRREPG